MMDDKENTEENIPSSENYLKEKNQITHHNNKKTILFISVVILIIILGGIGFVIYNKFNVVVEVEEFPATYEFDPDDPLKDDVLNMCLCILNTNLSYCENIDVNEEFKNDAIIRYWMKKMIWESNPDFCVNFPDEVFCRSRYEIELIDQNCSYFEDPNALTSCRAYSSKDVEICFEQDDLREIFNCRLLLNDSTINCEEDIKRYANSEGFGGQILES